MGEVTVKLRGRRHTFESRPGETILQAALRNGVRPPFLCTRGHCGTCILRVGRGAVHMAAHRALTDQEVEDGFALACQSIPTTPTTTVEFL